MYGYLAEAIETPEDRSWVTFHLNPRCARWHDGTPITVDDVIFSMETHRANRASPGKRQYYQRIETVQRVGANGVRFNLNDRRTARRRSRDRADADLQQGLLHMTTRSTRPAWSRRSAAGPIVIVTDVDPGPVDRLRAGGGIGGASDLPAVSRGQFNFDTLRYDYYRDATVALQAFTAGDYNYRLEFNLERWSDRLRFPRSRGTAA